MHAFTAIALNRGTDVLLQHIKASNLTSVFNVDFISANNFPHSAESCAALFPLSSVQRQVIGSRLTYLGDESRESSLYQNGLVNTERSGNRFVALKCQLITLYLAT